MRPRPALLLLIEHKLEDVVRELRELEAHCAELWLRVVSQAEGARGPERGNRLADRRVLGVGFSVHVARVREFAARGGHCAVDFAVCQGAEFRETQALGQRVDACVHEEA